jgi:hypothetical protein
MSLAVVQLPGRSDERLHGEPYNHWPRIMGGADAGAPE